MIMLVAPIAAVLFLFLVAEGALYLLRWYEISNRVYDSTRGWVASSFSNRLRPARTFIREWFFSILYVISLVIGFISRLFYSANEEKTISKMVKGSPVVVLIHGYMARPWLFWLIHFRLRRRSVPNVTVFGYKQAGNDFGEYRDRLRDFMLTVRAKTGINDVILVGHSFGGIIAFEYARAYGDDGDVKAVVALAAPFRGSRLAALAFTSLGRSLHPSNPVFADIVNTNISARFTSVFSEYDQFVLPYTNSEHPLADENVEINTCGHSGFYFDRKVFKIVLERIRGAVRKDRADAGNAV